MGRTLTRLSAEVENVNATRRSFEPGPKRPFRLHDGPGGHLRPRRRPKSQLSGRGVARYSTELVRAIVSAPGAVSAIVLHPELGLPDGLDDLGHG